MGLYSLTLSSKKAIAIIQEDQTDLDGKAGGESEHPDGIMKRIRTDRNFNRRASYAPRPMTQSERARLQPRDERGQFTAYMDERAGQDGVRRVHLFRGSQVEKGDVPARDPTTDLIVVDESNSFSSMGDGPRKNLTVVCSRVGDRRSFDKIAGTIPMKNGQRTKYSNTKEPALTRIVRGIANQDISIVERHARIDSKDLDDPSDKKRLYMEVLSKSIQDAIDLDRSKPVDIILDTPPLKINGELVGLGSRLSEEYGVRWFTTKRSASTPSLQVHDYVTGTVSDHVESIGSKDYLYRILERRVKK